MSLLKTTEKIFAVIRWQGGKNRASKFIVELAPYSGCAGAMSASLWRYLAEKYALTTLQIYRISFICHLKFDLNFESQQTVPREIDYVLRLFTRNQSSIAWNVHRISHLALNMAGWLVQYIKTTLEAGCEWGPGGSINSSGGHWSCEVPGII